MSSSHILVGIGTPEAGQKLVEPIGRMAKRLDAKVLLVHVTNTCESDDEESEALRQGLETLAVVAGELNDKGIETQLSMPFDNDVAAAIDRAAVENQCTMIVLGLTGQQVLTRLISGDVPGNIIRKAQIPVFLYPPDWDGSL